MMVTASAVVTTTLCFLAWLALLGMRSCREIGRMFSLSYPQTCRDEGDRFILDPNHFGKRAPELGGHQAVGDEVCSPIYEGHHVHHLP